MKTHFTGYAPLSWFMAAISTMIGILLASGCDSTSFVPPPSPELGAPAGSRARASSSAATALTPSATALPSLPNAGRLDAPRPPGVGAKILELILAKPPNADRIYLTQALRRDAGKSRLAFRSSTPEPGETIARDRMVSAIRTAIGRRSSVLIVEPIDDPGVVDLLYEARSREIAVLLLDRSVPSRGGTSIPYVTFEPFDGLGRQLIDAVLAAARLTQRLNEGRIVVLENRRTDPYSAERLSSLTKSLTAAGQAYEVLAFDGDRFAALKVLQKRFEAQSKVVIVLAEDDEGLGAALDMLDQRAQAGLSDFLLGGYMMYDRQAPAEILVKCAAVIDRSTNDYAIKVFQTARSLMEGKPVGDRVEVPMSMLRKTTYFVPVPAPKKDDSRPATKTTP